MKTMRVVSVAGVVLVGAAGIFFGSNFISRGQMQSISGSAALPDSQPDSIVRVVADSQGLASVPQDQIPRFGTFWVVYGAQPAVPLPFFPLDCDPASTPLFSLGPDGIFLVDASSVIVLQPNQRMAMLGVSTSSLVQRQVNSLLGLIDQVQASQMNMELDSLFPGDGGDGGGTNTYFGSSYTPVNYGTNLWIANFALSSGNAAGIISNTVADVPYEIQYVSDLTSTQWLSGGFILGSEQTNWTAMSMTNAPNYTNNLFLRIRSWADDGSGLPIWWQLQYFGTTGVDPYGNPAGDGWNNLYKFQHGMNPNVFYTPAAPPALTLFVDSTGTNVTLSWQSSSGNVSYYAVYENYSLIGTVPVDSLTTFNTTLDYIYFGSDTLGPVFQVVAYYTNSAASDIAAIRMAPSSQPTLQAQIVHSSQGPLELIMGNVPDAITIRLFWATNYLAEEYAHYDVAASNLVNGVYDLPDGMAGTFANYNVFIEILHQSGEFDYANYISFGNEDTVNPPDWPTWLNASARYLKNNLHFLLRSATVNHSFSYGSTYESPYESDYTGQTLSRPETGSSYEYSGYHYYDSTWGELRNEVFRPMEENFLWRNFAYVNGDLNTGASYSGGERMVGNTSGASRPEYEIQGVNLPPNAVSSPPLTDSTASYFFYPPVYSEAGLNVNGSGYVTLPTGVNNVYGLPMQSVKNYSDDEIDAGAAPIFTSDQFTGSYYGETASPSLATVGYYFSSQTPHDFYGFPLTPAPGIPGFSPTNTTPLLIAGIGQPFTVMGWAKQAIQNGYNNTYAYLEQFFDQAYTENTNGMATTNSAGVLSAYGEFLPTVPGPAALVTMPDIDTGARGTCMVYCVSLQLDANHDGTMDLSWSGSDATSQASPMKFWVNSGNDKPGTSSNLDEDLPVPPNPPNCSYGQIRCQRNLENFARLWVCGTPALSYFQNNYQVNLTWQNVSSGSPSINIYRACETNGGIGYLTNSATAGNQATNATYDTVLYGGTVTNGSTFWFPLDEFANAGDHHYLFEGAGVGCGQLVLTITQNGNTIAQVSAWLDLHDIKDFYEQAVITNNMSGAISNWSSTIQKVQPAIANLLGNDTNLIVFVHGFNVDNDDWLDDSDTVFKRLYWAGYQGKYTSVSWPDVAISWSAFINNGVYLFNQSELQAYKASFALTTYLNQLHTRFGGYRLNILAHSQGNAVVSEAIEQGAPFDTYILTQGALPDSSYDVNAPTDPSILVYETYPYLTPEWQPMGYHGVYTNMAALTGQIVNFYNTNDPVLAWWIYDQQHFKPNPNYFYNGTTTTNYGTIPGYAVTDPQESRANVSRSRTDAIGQSGPASAHGVIQSAVDLKAQFGFNNAFPADHSAQWTWPIQTTRPYYLQILKSISP